MVIIFLLFPSFRRLSLCIPIYPAHGKKIVQKYKTFPKPRRRIANICYLCPADCNAMPTSTPSGHNARIAYIDLLKGICIVLIVAIHCNLFSEERGVPPALTAMRVVPLFFFLSGLFFRPYSGFREFLLRKVNTLLVPYLFFQLTFGAGLFLKALLTHTLDQYSPVAVVRFFTVDNGPLWFVRCLLLLNLIYFVLDKWLPDKALRLAACFLPAVAAWMLYRGGYLLPEHLPAPWNYLILELLRLPQAMMALPLFCLGQLCHKAMRRPRNLRLELPLMILAACVLWLTAEPMNMHANRYGTNFFLFYLSVLALTLLLTLAGRMIDRLPAIGYLGRNTMIVLGIHFPVLLLLQKYVQDDLLLLVLTTLAMFPLIVPLDRWLPRLTGRKPLFPLHGGAGNATHRPV